MSTAKLFTSGGSQAVRLPKEFRFEDSEVSIRREGNAVVLEPKVKRTWPDGFFSEIRITDSGFKRPEQGALPDIPQID